MKDIFKMTKVLDEIRKFLLPHWWDENEPEAHAPTKYDPGFGFEKGARQEIG